jgi:two-component system response regulator YesN
VLKPVEEEILYDSLERAKQRLLERQKEKERVQISLFEKIQSADSDDTGIAFNYVKESIALIENYYVLGITIEEAAQKLGISSGHLSRLFKQSTKLTFNEYVRNVRIEKAIALLKDQSIKIYEIADLVGYLDVKYFTQTFKKITGLTPSEYRYRFFQASQAIDTE